jgi:thermitase
LIPLPARLEGVIAVTASSKNRKPWKDGFTGKHIAWATPGEEICHIKAKRIESGRIPTGTADTIVGLLGRGGEKLSFIETMVSASGTSYSTAFTAAAAALWLQYHSRALLIERYGRKNISKIFRTVATQHAMDLPPDWDQNKHGAGILNIQRLIEAPLP